MPRVSADARARILEGFVLEAVGVDPNGRTVFEKKRAIRRDEMRHATAAPEMAVQPEATIHGEDHPITSLFEFAVLRRNARHQRVPVSCRPRLPARSPEQPLRPCRGTAHRSAATTAGSATSRTNRSPCFR